MNDDELQAWWPELGKLVSELRLTDQSVVADLLVEAVRAASTSGEVLSGLGVVLREHRTLSSRLSGPGAKAWEAVQADVDRAYPGAKLGHWPALRRKSPP